MFIGSMLIIILIIIVLGVNSLVSYIETKSADAANFTQYRMFEYADYSIVNQRAATSKTSYDKNMPVQDKIKFYADIYKVNVDTALRIAKCESNFRADAENVNGSATGVYQFIRKTWKSYCSGDVYNADHNIICFMQLYPEHPEMWVCN